MMFEWNEKTLWGLRCEVTPNSAFLADYRNTYGVTREACCNFFDGYKEYLEELMEYDGIPDTWYSEAIKTYDSPDNLFGWYCCFAKEPLPVFLHIIGRLTWPLPVRRPKEKVTAA